MHQPQDDRNNVIDDDHALDKQVSEKFPNLIISLYMHLCV